MDKESRKMSPQDLRQQITSFLKEHKSGALATYLDDSPRCSPVEYFLGEDMNIYIMSAGGDKFKAIEQSSKVCFLVNTEYIGYRRIKGVQIFGEAITSLNNGTVFEEALKYAPEPYLLEMNRDFLKIIKIIPDKIVYLNSLETGDRTKQILEKDHVIVKEDVLTPIH